MMQAAKRYAPTASALLLGFVMTVLLAPIFLATADWYAQWDEINNPPATLQWNTIERLDPDSLRMTLLVTRHDNCQMVRLLGYTGFDLQAMRPVESLDRQDGRPPQDYPVGITVISRPWVMRGIYGNKMAISAYYDCADRVVKAPLLIGDVPEMKP